MAEFEILQKCDCLLHTYVSINFKAHISNRVARIQVTDNEFSDYV